MYYSTSIRDRSVANQFFSTYRSIFPELEFNLMGEWESKFFTDRILPNGGVSQESISLTPREGLVDLFWVDYFGKPYVDLFGEHSLEKVECLLNEKMGDDFFLAFSKDPIGWNDPSV